MQPSRTDNAAVIPDVYIWVGRWEDFQSYTRKRGKPWAPPWIKLYPQLLDDDAFMGLTEQARLLLVGLFMLFSKSRGSITKDTRSLSRKLNQRVTNAQLDSLNHAGFIDFCSGTVREQRWNAFWNCSVLDVDIDGEQEQEDKPKAVSEGTNGHAHHPLELAPLPASDPDADIDFNGPAIPQRTARG